MSLESDRLQWEKDALSVRLPSGIQCTMEEIGGVDCMWVADTENPDNKIIVYLHGGGLVVGSAITHQHLAASLAQQTNSSVLLVNYRLLPEHEYPAPLEDVLSVYQTTGIHPINWFLREIHPAVSYTHLTLPTNREV